MLIEIVEKYYNKDSLLREDLMKDYFYIGRLMGENWSLCSQLIIDYVFKQYLINILNLNDISN